MSGEEGSKMDAFMSYQAKEIITGTNRLYEEGGGEKSGKDDPRIPLNSPLCDSVLLSFYVHSQGFIITICFFHMPFESFFLHTSSRITY